MYTLHSVTAILDRWGESRYYTEHPFKIVSSPLPTVFKMIKNNNSNNQCTTLHHTLNKY